MKKEDGIFRHLKSHQKNSPVNVRLVNFDQYPLLLKKLKDWYIKL